MDRKQLITYFIGFLQRENAYESYFKNFKKRKNVEWRKTKHVGSVLKKGHPVCFLRYGFPWANSEEGGCFWGALDLKWRQKLHYLNRL